MEMSSFLSPSSLVFGSRNGQQRIWDFQGGPRTPANPCPLSVAVSVPVPPAPRSVSVELQHSRKSSSTKFSEFRPCIDIHKGKVKQIVGSSLSDLVGEAGDLITNFESEKSAAEFAELYKRDNLYGGHVIMLGADTNSQAAALDALSAYPGGLQLGGGVNPKNARVYLDAGASHVIVTSYIFKDGDICFEKLGELVHEVGKSRLVLDLSCRKRDGHYLVVTDRWQKFSDLIISEESLANLASYAAEFLVHGVDVEGKRLGIDKELVQLLGQWSPIPVTYAGGASTLSDLELIEEAGGGRVDVTVGSALDIFGGALPYKDVVAWHNHHVNSSS